jgi:hypothetical protein
MLLLSLPIMLLLPLLMLLLLPLLLLVTVLVMMVLLVLQQVVPPVGLKVALLQSVQRNQHLLKKEALLLRNNTI